MTKKSGFPTVRLRRLRHHPALRALVREVHLSPEKLILPLFVRTGENERRPIASMPGHYQISVDQLEREVEEAQALGIGGVILFGIPEEKDSLGSDSLSDDGIIQQALREVKRVAPELLLVSDTCFCEYTDHGHCGPITEKTGRPDVDNDATIELLGQQAVSHVRAGADMIAPSGMMDGMVGAIRTALDTNNFQHIPIMSYAAKYASAYYGPFRDAAESAPQFGDRRSYQMDPMADPAVALREVELDLAEGADLIMVKPALAYLDIIRVIKDSYPGVPLAAYNVSGEYSMVKAASEKGWIDEQTLVLETLAGITRAGAGIILTYWAKDVAKWLN